VSDIINDRSYVRNANRVFQGVSVLGVTTVYMDMFAPMGLNAVLRHRADASLLVVGYFALCCRDFTPFL
jgi:hypothetical protein